MVNRIATMATDCACDLARYFPYIYSTTEIFLLGLLGFCSGISMGLLLGVMLVAN